MILVRQRLVPANLIEKEDLARMKSIKKVLKYPTRVNKCIEKEVLVFVLMWPKSDKCQIHSHHFNSVGRIRQQDDLYLS